MLAAIALGIMLSTCSSPPSLLERILRTGELKVVTRNTPAAFYYGADEPRGIEYELTRVRLSDGWETTVYLVRHPLATTSPRVVWFPEPERLDHWCAAHGHPPGSVTEKVCRPAASSSTTSFFEYRHKSVRPVSGSGPRTAAIGTFDGVHLGHREVIRGSGTVLTFDPHPL